MTRNKDLEGETYSNLGFAYYSLRRLQKAFEFCQRALRIAKGTGKTDSEGKTYEYLGSCCLRLGDVKKAFEFYQQCLSIPKETGEKQREGLVYGYLSRAYTYLSWRFKNSIRVPSACS